ncbi:Zinc finger protein JAGGED [Camellia lanceoleosa]|uniref:Zinc finger protein JAGGED n=1 Tax=Camellia lanceoleosa TaxID=1840588 RepID=A0ACC0GC57_9ERIC|nr:Zinc finger protein JAGGED [Camellia lanceoleosa]
MRPEGNPLDLNNLPDDYSRDGKQVVEESSSSAGYRKKKSGAKDGKDECEKVYECRFCSLKFCKSQALGGHMNRHRQERETETLNRARQLVFGNDNLAAQGAHHLGCQPVPHGGGYHQTSNIGDPTLPFRPAYPTRLFSGSSSTLLQSQPPPPPPHHQPYIYTSPSHLVSYQANDYIVGHALSGRNTQYGHLNPNYATPPPPPPDTNYTCIGAPVGYAFPPGSRSGGVGGGRDVSLNNQDEGLNWGRSYTGTQKHLDPSSINRFQDGF